MSSAHVYARLEKGQTIDDMPQALIDDCAQLVKANSIQVGFGKREFFFVLCADESLLMFISLSKV